MRTTPVSVLAALLIAGPLLAGCSSSSFDPTDAFDFLNLSKEEKLKGERKPLFPEGVPGVQQGIPPELVKGYKPPETAAEVVAPPPEEKPKPRVVRRAPEPKSKPTSVTVRPESKPAAPQQAKQQPAASPWPDAKQQQQPQQQPQQQQTGAQAPWPAPQQQQQTSTPSATSPWPDPPPPTTFQR